VGEKKRIEPWPVALAAALLFMICVSVTFFFVARANPDPVISVDRPPGLER
jgi:hypothetical protein